MALFEEIGKRITNASQEVVKQTRDLTDISRLNTKISENKKEMSQLLFELGNDYYKKHRREQDNEEKIYIDQINRLFDEVVKWEDAIEAIKASEVCRACGCRVPKGSVSCANCGARLGADSFADAYEEGTRVCQNCGAVVSDDSVFCTSCGTKIEVITEEPAGEGELDVAKRFIRACPSCGSKVEEGDLFCIACGKKL